ncbi:hypothetical protein ACFPVT_10425 [Corynebacterium choanae]|uniref:hypothetical protein n=1 Tax=Corynebacterium choanae TaxID=1862358 RepID=UPI000F500547|nr:hypothetical protein [Corynebacterium choanae]
MNISPLLAPGTPYPLAMMSLKDLFLATRNAQSSPPGDTVLLFATTGEGITGRSMLRRATAQQPAGSTIFGCWLLVVCNATGY